MYGRIIGMVGVLSAMVVGVATYRLQGEVNAMRLEVKIYEGENRCLRDQCLDLEGTYDRRVAQNSHESYQRGFTDALARTKESTWVDGYHAAMAQVTDMTIAGIAAAPSPAPVKTTTSGSAETK